MVKVWIHLLLSLITISCSFTTPGGELRFPSSELPSSDPGYAENPPVGSDIQILSYTEFSIGSNDYPGNIIFDGTRILYPVKSSSQYLGNNVNFQYLSPALSPQGVSLSNYPGIGAINGTIYSAFPTVPGFSAIFWTTSAGATNGTLSIRNNSDGIVTAHLNRDLANYGCRAGSDTKLTYCNTLYFGACYDSSFQLRLFSFDASGSIQSGVTKSDTDLSIGNLGGLVCLRDQNLILISGNGTMSFRKYNLGFDLITNGTNTSQNFNSCLRYPVGITTDGDSLYIQGRRETSGVSTSFCIGKSTLGNLD